tara:strand:- start:55 stop:294 length:240 start_codon:yes stop_codon:yes gene_type:complete
MSADVTKGIDLKFLVTMAAIIAALGGFYYTTSFRIEKLENDVAELKDLSTNVVRLEEQIKIIQKQNDEIYKILINLNNE